MTYQISAGDDLIVTRGKPVIRLHNGIKIVFGDDDKPVRLDNGACKTLMKAVGILYSLKLKEKNS